MMAKNEKLMQHQHQETNQKKNHARGCNYNFASPLSRLCLMPMQTTKSYAPENKVKIHMIYELDIALRAVDGAIGHRPCEVSCIVHTIRGIVPTRNALQLATQYKIKHGESSPAILGGRNLSFPSKKAYTIFIQLLFLNP